MLMPILVQENLQKKVVFILLCVPIYIMTKYLIWLHD